MLRRQRFSISYFAVTFLFQCLPLFSNQNMTSLPSARIRTKSGTEKEMQKNSDDEKAHFNFHFRFGIKGIRRLQNFRMILPAPLCHCHNSFNLLLVNPLTSPGQCRHHMCIFPFLLSSSFLPHASMLRLTFWPHWLWMRERFTSRGGRSKNGLGKKLPCMTFAQKEVVKKWELLTENIF